jgi:hypothetical protein
VTRQSSRARSIGARVTGHDEYGIALGLILLTILASAASPLPLAQLAAAIIASATLVFILRTSKASRRDVRTVVFVAVATLVLATVAVWLGLEERNPYSVVIILMSIIAPVAIVRRLLAGDAITLQTVAGALCIYLLIGLFFASLYSIFDGVEGRFFTQTTTPNQSDFLYFSYITITTVGYGDLTAASPFGQMLAVTEALVGQIYLVAGVAVLVSNLGRRRKGDEAAPTDMIDELRALVDDAESESVP